MSGFHPLPPLQSFSGAVTCNSDSLELGFLIPSGCALWGLPGSFLGWPFPVTDQPEAHVSERLGGQWGQLCLSERL